MLIVPANVKMGHFVPNVDKISCNDTRRVQWQPINTSSCSVEYTTEFRNCVNDINGTVKNINNNFHCTVIMAKLPQWLCG